MSIRADRYTINTKQVEAYSDFTLNFDLNPITGFLAKVTNEDSVKQALKSIILTQRTERLYNKYVGTRLRSLMFEPMDSVTEESIKSEILESIKNNESRVFNVSCTAEAKPNDNAYAVTIYFEIINIPDQNFSLSLILKRVR